MSDFDRHIARLAAAQHGVFGRAQATSLGASKAMISHRLERGIWERFAPDVFGIAGAASTYRRALLATTLEWGDGAVASHRAAAALLHLAGVDARPLEITVPRARRRDGAQPDVIVHRNALEPRERTMVEAIPTTTPARTLIDLAAVVPREITEEALDDALRRGLVSIARLRSRLTTEMRGRRPGFRALREMVEARTGTGVPQSVFETRLLRLLARARLPRPVVQHRIVDLAGRLVAIADFAYPHARVAIEADGHRWHSGRARWERDRRRLNALTRLGWRVIHVTWAQLQARPDEITSQIAEILVAPTRGTPTPKGGR